MELTFKIIKTFNIVPLLIYYYGPISNQLTFNPGNPGDPDIPSIPSIPFLPYGPESPYGKQNNMNIQTIQNYNDLAIQNSTSVNQFLLSI